MAGDLGFSPGLYLILVRLFCCLRLHLCYLFLQKVDDLFVVHLHPPCLLLSSLSQLDLCLQRSFLIHSRFCLLQQHSKSQNDAAGNAQSRVLRGSPPNTAHSARCLPLLDSPHAPSMTKHCSRSAKIQTFLHVEPNSLAWTNAVDFIYSEWVWTGMDRKEPTEKICNACQCAEAISEKYYHQQQQKQKTHGNAGRPVQL